MFRVISLNANGIRAAARKGFFEWMKKQDADVVCIQETKAQVHQLTDDVGLSTVSADPQRGPLETFVRRPSTGAWILLPSTSGNCSAADRNTSSAATGTSLIKRLT